MLWKSAESHQENSISVLGIEEIWNKNPDQQKNFLLEDLQI